MIKGVKDTVETRLDNLESRVNSLEFKVGKMWWMLMLIFCEVALSGNWETLANIVGGMF